MGAVCSCCRKESKSDEEPLMQDNEREAVTNLIRLLQNRSGTIAFEGPALHALTTLSYSQNTELQRSAALSFAEITERHVEEVDATVLDPLLFLLRDSNDVEVQQAASAALGNLAVNIENKLKIVRLGGLEPLIRQMNSSNVEVQCNAVGCVTNLATHEENKNAIALSGALIPLTRLAKNTKDIRVQRNATGALLNMTHSEENRRQLVDAGAVSVLVTLLRSPDDDVVYYCTTSLSNLAVDAYNRKRLNAETRLVNELVDLLENHSLKIQCQAALALRNLASDDKYQLEITSHPRGLSRILRLLSDRPNERISENSKISSSQVILAAVACIRNISIHPQNESRIIDAGFLKPLVSLLSYENEEIRCHSISTLRNLAAGHGFLSEENDDMAKRSAYNKEKIVESGVLEKLKLLLSDAVGTDTTNDRVFKLGWPVLSELTACIAVCALSDRLKNLMINDGILNCLLPLTHSSVPSEVQGNAAAAIGNLATKVQDMRPFASNLPKISEYLERFLEPTPSNGTHYHEADESAGTFQHIAIWTLLQLCENRDEITNLIRESSRLIDLIKNLPPHTDEQIRSLTSKLVDSLGMNKS